MKKTPDFWVLPSSHIPQIDARSVMPRKHIGSVGTLGVMVSGVFDRSEDKTRMPLAKNNLKTRMASVFSLAHWIEIDCDIFQK